MIGKYAEEMNWKEIESEFKAGTLVVVPLGAGCKEHGFHMPMNTDKILADFFALKIVEKLPVLVMPTITYSFFPAFLDYAGSTSLDLDTTTKMFVSICSQWHQQGARSIYILNFGVSTNKPLQAAQEALSVSGIQMQYTDLIEFDKQLDDISEQEGGTHADELETSMMLHIRPDVVKMEHAEEDFDNKLGKLTPYKTDDPNAAYSPTGAWGNPTLATPEKGKIIVERLLDYLIDEITALLK